MPKRVSDVINNNNPPCKKKICINHRKPGIILKMLLKNFMCHSLLEVKFEDNVNFVVGRNGSGKSAILAALVVGLGAKATVTNRGKSIKNFIKAGTSSASVEITLCNEGKKAYKPQIYGPAITIERVIQSSGSSSYKIKAASGKLVSKKSKEIEKISRAFCLQIENPVCILNQDTSRNFLCSSDPKTKFALFYKATCLEEMYELYKDGVSNLKQASQEFDRKTEAMQQLHEHIKELEKKLQRHEHVQTLIEDLVAMNLEILWSNVVSTEKNHNKQEESVGRSRSELETLLTRSGSQEEVMKEINAKLGTCQEKINELTNAVATLNAPIDEAKKKLSDLKDALKVKERADTVITLDIQTKERDCDGIKKDIENFSARLSEFDQKRIEKERELNNLKEQLKSNETLKSTMQNDQYQISSDLRSKEEDYRNIELEIQAVQKQIRNGEENLTALQKESNNRIAVYGNHVASLVKLINDNKAKFSQPPRGPIGAYVSVKDKKWVLAVESLIGGSLLSAFIVNNGNDARILYGLMDRIGGKKPTVITTKFFHQVHDVSANMTEEARGCVGLFKAIAVSDAVVMNCLIDQVGLEHILLVPTINLAMEMFSNKENVPYKCYQGVTAEGDKFYPDPNYKFYSGTYNRPKYLDVVRADMIRDYQQTIKEHTATLQQLHKRCDGLKDDLRRRRKTLGDINVRLQQCQQCETAVRKQLLELQSIDEPDIGSVSQLEIELNELKQNIIEREATREKIKSDMNVIKEEIASVQEDIKKRINEKHAIYDKIAPIEREMNEQQLALADILTNKDRHQQRIAELKKALRKEESALEQHLLTLNEQISFAQAKGERMENIRSVHDLNENIETATRKLNRLRSETENPDDLLEQFQEEHEIYNRTNSFLSTVEPSIIDLKKKFKQNKRDYENSKHYLENYITYCFTSFLKRRTFKGHIAINFDEGTLELVVMPQAGSQGAQTTSNLSGGERSFSTVAFLYSLWQCMQFPFYFLDEFDVFMDPVNRTLVMQILIEHAKRNKDTQFVFLTPQDVSFIKDSEVALYRLDDPERN